jgi:molybdenum cofactor biosynthesis enzyme MoaA
MRVAKNHVQDRLNRSLRDLRISVTDRCNFRCTYCMPEEKYHRNFQFLKTNERLNFAEIVRLAGLFTAAGVRKLRITGGEPLLRPALGDLIGDLRALPNIEEIALTTNGILLGQHAAGLKAAGLDRVTVSLDSLDDEVFKAMSGGRGGLSRVLDGIDAALEADLTPLKINAVVQRGVYLYEDGAGEVGFISSVSEPFCGTCHRARLSSDGQLFTCLFATRGTDLRQPMREGATDEELFGIIHRVWTRRTDRYSELRAELLRHGREIHKPEMYYIGG